MSTKLSRAFHRNRRKALEESQWWQKLNEWIFDDNKVITYKNLASDLNIHVNTAKKMLVTFYQYKSKELSVCYLMYGQTKNGHKVQVTTDKDLKKVEDSFKKISSKHVFALYKAKMDVSSTDIRKSMNEFSPSRMTGLRGIADSKIQMKVSEQNCQK